MKIFISHAHKDNDLAIKLIECLKQNDYKILGDFNLRLGENFDKKLNNDILEADAIIFLITSNFNKSVGANKELTTAYSYYSAQSQPRLLPILFEDVELPDDLHGIVYLSANHNDFDNDLVKIVTSLEIIRNDEEKNQKMKEKSKEVIQASLANYIDKVMKRLNMNERNNKFLSYSCYSFSAFLIGASIAFSVFRTNIIFTIDNWELSASKVVSGVLTLTLMIALSRFLFVLGKSFMVESIRNGDRIHAISFGEFFLNAYGSVASRNEVREVFGDWNIDNGSSFITQSPKDYDPQILESVVNAIKNITIKKL